MADEPEDDAAKLRLELRDEMKALITKEKYQSLSVHYIVVTDDTGESGFGGTMCPVCAAEAMMGLVIHHGLMHTSPSHVEERMKLAKKMLEEAFGINMDDAFTPISDTKKHTIN